MLEINNRDLKGRFFLADSIEPGNEVDHAAVSPAAKAMKTPVDLHTGRPVLMEGTPAHAPVLYRDSVSLSCLSGRYCFLYFCKYTQLNSSL